MLLFLKTLPASSRRREAGRGECQGATRSGIAGRSTAGSSDTGGRHPLCRSSLAGGGQRAPTRDWLLCPGLRKDGRRPLPPWAGRKEGFRLHWGKHGCHSGEAPTPRPGSSVFSLLWPPPHCSAPPAGAWVTFEGAPSGRGRGAHAQWPAPQRAPTAQAPRSAPLGRRGPPTPPRPGVQAGGSQGGRTWTVSLLNNLS